MTGSEAIFLNIPALLTYMAIMAITPGPSNLMCLYLGATKGIRGAVPFMAGSLTGLFVKSILCGLLNFILAEKIPELVPYLKWVGCAYMLYLAYSMIQGALRKEEDVEQTGEGSFSSGILLQVLNIKSWVAALSIFSVYVVPYTTSIWAVLMTSLVFALFCIPASLIWCACGTAIQGIYQKYRLPVSCLLAATLVLCALSALK